MVNHRLQWAVAVISTLTNMGLVGGHFNEPVSFGSFIGDDGPTTPFDDFGQYNNLRSNFDKI